MARQLRIDLPGAIQHVTNRGNNRERIFYEEADKELFLDLVVAEAERCGWVIHDYALLDNHFHLLIETPEANLSRGMQRLQTTYVQRFNRKYRRIGHLFQSRFGSSEEPSLLKKLVYGSEAFIQRIQEWIDSEQRSKEHPRYQREIGRPPIDAITAAVCQVLGRTPEELRTKRGDLARLVFAELGYWEGLRTLREIARELGLRSAAHVSNLVNRCREERRRDPVLQAIVDRCLDLARQKAPPLPEHYLARVPI